MKKDDFDLEILENADNEVIDALNSFPSADEETKRRVFSMSEKKFNDLNNNFEATDENSVKGVETYRRPKWYRTVCVAAAALVLVGGGTATFAALHKTKKSNESMQAASEIETEPTLSDKINSQNSILNEIEMKSIYERLFLPYMEICRGNDIDRNDPDQEYITFYVFWNYEDKFDEESRKYVTDTLTDDIKVKDGKVYVGVKFYKINNPNFHTLDGVKEVMGQYVSEKFYTSGHYYLNRNGYSDYNFDSYEDGDFIEDAADIGEIIQYRDQLYTLMYEQDSFDPNNCEVTYEKAFPISNTSFIWECYYHLNDDPDNIEIVNALIELDDNYEWKISDVSLAPISYELEKDFKDGDEPALMHEIYLDALAENNIETDYNENDITGEPEPVSETDDEETDENRGEIIKNEGIDISQIAPIAAEPSKSVKDYSDEELNEVAKQLVNIYADWDTLIVSDTVTCEDSVGFYMDGDIPDFSYNYYLLNDPRFSNMKEMVEYYSPYMDEALILSSCEDRNGIENGTYLDPKVYPDYQSTPNLIEHDGKLYAGAYGSPYFEVTGYSIDKKEDDYFIVSVDTDAFTDINLKLKIAKSDDGNFKVVDDQDCFPYGKSFD